MLTIPRKIALSMFQGLVKSTDLEDILRRAVRDSELFKQRFRHTASRSFMILKNYKGREVSINRQQVRSSFLLDYLTSAEDVPVIEETYREVLEDVMDIQNARHILEELESGQVSLRLVEFTMTPSPFAHNVVLAGTSDIVLMEDRSSLLRELHRKVLSKVLGSDTQQFEFKAEDVSAYFRQKIGNVDSKDALLDLLRRAGPMHIFKEKGRNVYPFTTVPREMVDGWAVELLREGRIRPLLIDDLYFIAAEDMPIYASALRHERSVGETEQSIMDLLDRPKTIPELESALGLESAKVLRALRNLESSLRITRSDLVDGKWLYVRMGAIPEVRRQDALDKVVAKNLECFAPSTVEEVAFSLGLEEDEVRHSLTALVEEGAAAEGRFIISEHTQYMLKRDHLRLRARGQNIYDLRTVESFRRSKQNRPFGSIEECVRFFGEVGMPIDVQRRVPNFRLEDWAKLRSSGKLLSGRFMRGRVRYVLAQDAPAFVAAYRALSLSFLDEQVLSVLKQNDGLSMRQLVSITGLDKEEAKECLDRLDRNMYVVRKFEDGEDWSRENYYIPYEAPECSGDARRIIVERVLRAFGPMPLYAIKMYTDFPLNEVEVLLQELSAARIIVGDHRTEMAMMPEELEALNSHRPSEEEMVVVSLYDPEVQPMWAEIASRFGEGWIYPILNNGRLVGATEKWEMSGCVELRSLDLDDPGLLPEALRAVDRMMEYYRSVGYDVIRIREVLGKGTEELTDDVHQVLESNGYSRLSGMYAKGNIVTKQYGDERLMAYVLRKQHLAPDDRFTDPLNGIRATGGFRSDTQAWQRSKLKWPLKKLYDQGTLMKVFGIPEYVTYVTPEWAKLYRKAKGVPDDKDCHSILHILEKEGPTSRRQLFDLSPMGHKGTYEALKKLTGATAVHQDRGGKVRLVPDMDISQSEAVKRVVKLAFKNYGIFTAEELSRFLRFGVGMKQIRQHLADLEKEGYLVKGFLRFGSDSLHWVLKEDAESLGEETFPHSFVLSPDDTLIFYLMPQIKAKFGQTMPFHVVFDGTEMVALVRTNSRGKEIAINEFIGPASARKIMNEHIRNMGLTLRESLDDDRQKEWEIQEFYERTHSGEEDD